MKLVLSAAALAASLMLAPAAHAQTASETLTQLFADERAEVYRSDPLSATYEGIHTYDDRLASVTPAENARQTDANRAFLTRLHAVDRNAQAHAASPDAASVLRATAIFENFQRAHAQTVAEIGGLVDCGNHAGVAR